MHSTYNYIVGLLGAFLGFFLGGLEGFIEILITFIVIDYITGFLAGIKRKKLSSNIGFWGIVKKMIMFVVVGMGHLIDTHIIGGGSVLRTAIIFFFLSNEGISILENISVLGVEFPEKLKEVLIQIRDKNNHK